MTQWKNRTTAWHNQSIETERGGCESAAMALLILGCLLAGYFILEMARYL